MAKTWIAVAGDTEEIYRSVDDGANWVLAFTAPASSYGFTSSLATDEAGVWCVGDLASNIWRSDDDGITWAIVQNTGAGEIKGMATDRAGVWCAADDYGQLYRSTDNGVTWAYIVPQYGAYRTRMATDRAGVWCAEGNADGSIYRSSNNGASWALTATLNDGTARLAWSIATNGSGIWCAGCYPGGQIWRSTNNGVDWSLIYDSPEAAFYAIASDGGVVWCAGAGSATLYRSSDSGINWTPNLDMYSEYGIYSLATDRANVWCAGTGDNGKIFRSIDNGANWTLAYTCPTAARIVSIAAGGIGPATIKLLSLKPTQDRSDYVTRVYPRASGISLAVTTRVASGNYALDAAAGYIVNTAAEALYGRRERPVTFTLDMPTGSDTDDEAKVLAANALYDKGLEWLGQHDSIPTNYTAKVTGQTTLIESLTTIHLLTTTTVDGDSVHSLDADFNIVKARNYLNDASQLEADLELSTLEREAVNDAQVIADAVVNASKPSGGGSVSSVSTVVSRVEGTADINGGTIDGTVIGQEVPANATFTNVTLTGALALPAKTANTVLAGPASGADAAPTFRALVEADLPSVTLTQSAVAAVTLAAGDFVNLYNDSGTLKARLADCSSNRAADGYVLANYDLGATATVYLDGFNTSLAALTLGDMLYLSTIGDATATAPTTGGHIVQPIGQALTATKAIYHREHSILLAT